MSLADDKGQRSTYRELKAIYHVLASYVSHFIENKQGPRSRGTEGPCPPPPNTDSAVLDKKVKVFTDINNDARIVLVGSAKHHLQ